mmetsp:Transcript_11459/g.11463  ORF Transcript_11459/g.11463 Transcript_11459/m.11463 type:complete len:151 (-) Transcript_11459:52-504(-)
MRKGSTWDEITDKWSDQYIFRKQNCRSLSEIDILIRRQEYLRNKIGEQLAMEIELQPELHYDFEKFRIWQAKARFRAALSTAVVCPSILVVLNGNKNGIGYARAHPIISSVLFMGTFVGSFFVWHRLVGYNNHDYYVLNFAKNVKQLRNI